MSFHLITREKSNGQITFGYENVPSINVIVGRRNGTLHYKSFHDISLLQPSQ